MAGETRRSDSEGVMRPDVREELKQCMTEAWRSELHGLGREVSRLCDLDGLGRGLAEQVALLRVVHDDVRALLQQQQQPREVRSGSSPEPIHAACAASMAGSPSAAAAATAASSARSARPAYRPSSRPASRTGIAAPAVGAGGSSFRGSSRGRTRGEAAALLAAPSAPARGQSQPEPDPPRRWSQTTSAAAAAVTSTPIEAWEARDAVATEEDRQLLHTLVTQIGRPDAEVEGAGLGPSVAVGATLLQGPKVGEGVSECMDAKQLTTAGVERAATKRISSMIQPRKSVCFYQCPPPAASRLHQAFIRIVSSASFDFGICCAVLLNAVVIGIEVDIHGRSHGRDKPKAFAVISGLFLFVFAAELAARIYIYGGRLFFVGADAAWNLFDTVVVLVQAVEEIINATTVSDLDMDHNLKIIKVVRILKLLRVIRVLRIVRFVPELNQVVYLIFGSLSSFVWTFSLMMLLLYVMGIFCTQLVADYASEQNADTARSLRMYFGSLGDSILSTFQAVSGGIDWRDLTSPLMQITPVLAVFIFGFVAFTVLVMLNLVTGMFVDSAQKLHARDTERALVKQLHRVFDEVSRDDRPSGGFFDREPTGDVVMTREAFVRRLQGPEMEPLLENLGIEAHEGEMVFRLLDTFGDGALTCEQFVLGGLHLQGPAKAIDLAKTRQQVLQELRALRLCLDRPWTQG